MQEYTQSGGVRPFGVSLLVAGLDGDGTPALYQVDPSGAYFGWKATAIGKSYVSAKNFLEKRWTRTTFRWESFARTASSRSLRRPRSKTTWTRQTRSV
jgi:20S proteasome alpha/beta subunit